MSDPAAIAEIENIPALRAEHAVRIIRETGLRTALPYMDELYKTYGEGADRLLVRAGGDEALVDRMISSTLAGRGKELNQLYAELKLLVGDKAPDLVAESFAERARKETAIHPRSRLYKLACRHVDIAVVAEAFATRHIQVLCPLDGRHPVSRIGAWRFASQLAAPGWANSAG